MKTIIGIAQKKSIHLLLLIASVGLLATGCTTYQQQNHAIEYWRQGNIPQAAAEAVKMADDNTDNKDTVIWRLEEGAVLRANGQYDDSNKAFDEAADKIDHYEEAAKISVSGEAGAFLSNQAELPYEGRSYDGIMLNTYKALNYLQLGQPDSARPELIRAYQRQQDAVEDNARRIEKTQNAAAQSKDKAAMDRAQANPKFQSQMQGTYAALDNLQPYADYVNPFTVYLDGIYFMANASDASDLQRAQKSLQRVGTFLGNNDFITQDLATVDDLINGKPLPQITYVIFETGCAPVRDQVRIDIPIIVSSVSYVGAAFPTLKFQNNYVNGLTVTADGTNTTTTLLASMDSVIGLDFKNEMPVVITKTIASTVTKAIAAYAINQAANQQNAMFGLLTQLGTAAYQAAVNVADERTWTTLPKEFEFCRIPTPPDRKLSIFTPDGSQNQTVTIGDGTVNIIYVKSINSVSPLLVTQMKLK